MTSKCAKCGKLYYYDVDRCIFCFSEVKKAEPKSLKVITSTEVMVPSKKHKQVPYFNLLLEDEQGNFHLKKSAEMRQEGDLFNSGKSEETQKIPVGVIGTGATGAGIAESALMKGHKVILISRTEERLKKIKKDIETFLLKFVSNEGKENIMKNFTPSTDINDLKDCVLIIESVIEDKKTKDEFFRKIDKVNNKAVIASNTSSLSITEFSKNLENPSRMIGIHFFNPVHRMALVEIVKTEKSTDKAVNLGVEFAKGLGKVPVITKDAPCFIVNRILMPYLNEAAMLLEDNVATKEDIDMAAKLGLNHPMGPLELIDLIGLDVFREIMANLHKRTGSGRYKAAGIITKMVKEGKLGRKTGEGFYTYK